MILTVYRKDDLDPEIIIDSEDIVGFKHTDEDYEVIVNKTKFYWIDLTRENWLNLQKQWLQLKKGK